MHLNHQPDSSEKRFSFHVTGNDLDSKIQFYKHFMRIASANAPELDDLVNIKMKSEVSVWDRTTFYGAFNGEELVGTIACIEDDPTTGIPFERGHSQPIDLSEIRKHGRILEIGLFSIDDSHAGARDILAGLFKFVIAHSVKKKVSFLGTQSAENRLPMYKKIGFIALTQHPVLKHVTHFPVIPAIYNFARDYLYENSRSSSLINHLMTAERKLDTSQSSSQYEDFLLASSLNDDHMLSLIGGPPTSFKSSSAAAYNT